MKETGRFLKEYRGNECLNCGVPLDLIDKYCHHCGQTNTTKKLSFKDFFDEFFASIFSYDSRLRHTIITLLFYPGKISKEYIKGKRIRYANPFRFYLSVSIIFFIINSLFIDFDSISNSFGQRQNNEVKAFNFSYEGESIKNIEQKDKISDSIRPSTKEIKPKKNTYVSESQLDTLSTFNSLLKRLETYQSYYKDTKEFSADIALDSLKHRKSQYTKYLYKRGIKTQKLSRDPSVLIKFVFNKLPFFIFFFLPFLAMGVWILYLRRSFTYMEHLVFTFHTQTLFFILTGITSLISEITDNDIFMNIGVFVFLFYLIMAMKKFYNQKWGKTIVKFLLVNVLFFILAGIGSIITLIGSIFIF